MNKLELRIKFKEKRKLLNIKEKSQIISDKIRMSEIYQTAKNVMLFYPTKFEVDLLDLLTDNKNFYFPKVSGKEILVCPHNGAFVKSNLNILEPASEPINPNLLDLVVVPALAVDKTHYRLGYGGGYYDRFLAKFPNLETITPIFKELIVDELPKNSFDIKVKLIISD